MRHIPVLLQQVLSGLNISELNMLGKKPVVVDCNLGDGGHSEEIIKALRGNVTLIGFDMDPEAIERATANIAAMVKREKSADTAFAEPNLILVNDNFRNLKATFSNIELGVMQGNSVEAGVALAATTDPIVADAILFDLGISSYEIDESGRGFSFKRDEPLAMTFGKAESHTFNAYDIVNTWDEENIADIIFGYGEDKFSRRIAKVICEHRENIAKDGTKTGAPIKTTAELAELVRKAYPGFARHGRVHPATKTFQALRIAVNDELRSIEEVLPQAFEILGTGKRLAVITFHSLEDRIVKRFFKEKVDNDEARAITKKPIIPEDSEVEANPRSRSSKLRIVEKI